MTNDISLHPGGIKLTIDAAAQAGLSAGDKVLDIGCGTGASLAVLADRLGIIPYGLDISDRIIEAARSIHPGIRFECCGAYTLPFDNGFFDAVMLECVLTLLDDPEAALAEAVRVLRPGGRLLLSTLVSTRAGHFEICRDGLADPAALICCLNDMGMTLLCSDDHKKELTDYMIETIMEYGSLDDRIASETARTGASVFKCGCSPDPGSVTYSAYVFTKC